MDVAKDISVPKQATLYHYRVDLDLASMLWARKYRFGLEAKWVVHCRIDSSPQFGRDFLMGECDIVYLAGVGSWLDIGREGVLYSTFGGANGRRKGIWRHGENTQIVARPIVGISIVAQHRSHEFLFCGFWRTNFDILCVAHAIPYYLDLVANPRSQKVLQEP